MSQGTLSLTNGSKAVTGTGTAFTSDAEAGGWLIFHVGGMPFTVAVESVHSDTSLTMADNFDGATATGIGYSGVPLSALIQIPSLTSIQARDAIRRMMMNDANFQQLLTGPDDVTINRPDGSSFSGPSWPKIVDMLSDGRFLEAGENLSDLPDKSQGRVNLGIDRIDQKHATETQIWADSAKDNYSLTLQTDGNWGMYSEKAGLWRPLGIEQGGTSGTTLAAARSNLQIDRIFQNNEFVTIAGGSDNSMSAYLILTASGQWGMRSANGSPIPLDISSVPAVGVVSQASGVPTGAIIEKGANANGTYTKFADGTMICRGSGSYLKTSNGSGGYFESTPDILGFPATFASAPTVTTSGYYTGSHLGASGAWGIVISATSAAVTLLLVSSISNGGGRCDYIAIGRWF